MKNDVRGLAGPPPLRRARQARHEPAAVTGRGPALASLRRGFAHGADLHQTWEDENADSVLLDVRFDDIRQTVKHRRHLSAAEFSAGSNLLQNLAFGLSDFNWGGFLCHPSGFAKLSADVKAPQYRNTEEI